MHKLKDKVSREVAKMYKDFEHTVRADGQMGKKCYRGDDSCCLGGDEHVDGQGGGLQGLQGGGVGHQGGRQGGQGHDRE